MANGATSPGGSYNLNANTTGTVQGPRMRGDVQAARRVIQSTQGILINANVTPVLAATEKVGKGTIVYDAVEQHNEYDVTPGFVTLDDGTGGLGSGSGYSSSGTSFTVSTGQGSRIKVYDTLKYLATGEIVWVTARAGDVLTVVRAFTATATTATGGAGGASGAAIPASAELQILRAVFPQNSAKPAGKSTEPLIVSTYLQCSRYVVEASRRTIDAQNYGIKGGPTVDEWQRIHDAVIVEGQQCDERAILHNQGTTSMDNGTYGTMTDGIPARILTNRFNISGSLDETTLENYAISVYRYNQGQDSKLINFVGENVIKTIDQFARDNMRYTPDVTILGSKCVGWRCMAGTLNFTKHGMFSPLSSSALYSAGSPIGWMLSVNFANIEKLTFGKNGGMRYDANAKTPGQDGTVGCWTEDYGIKMRNERSHGFMYGVSGL